jgi:hypothetical protein
VTADRPLVDPRTYQALVDAGEICEHCGRGLPQTHGTCCSGACLVDLLCRRQVREKAWDRLVEHYGSPDAVWAAAMKAFK